MFVGCIGEHNLRLNKQNCFIIIRNYLIMHLSHGQLRDLAWECGLAAPHQRQTINEAIITASGHYSLEHFNADARKRIPSISLATVYNNLELL